MKLDNLYLISKNLKKIENFYRKGMEVVYYLDRVEHEFLQQECYAKINKSINGYQSQDVFEISFFDVKFVFKRLPG